MKKFYLILKILLILAALIALSYLVTTPDSEVILKRPWPDKTVYENVVITLERTQCYGTCPGYKLTIYGNGKVVYDGEKYVKVIGTQTAQISQDKVKEIVDEFYQADYFLLQDEYTEDITDMPATITSITIDGKTKEVLNRYGAPKKLADLENKIDEITNSKSWVDCPSHQFDKFGQCE